VGGSRSRRIAGLLGDDRRGVRLADRLRRTGCRLSPVPRGVGTLMRHFPGETLAVGGLAAGVVARPERALLVALTGRAHRLTAPGRRAPRRAVDLAAVARGAQADPFLAPRAVEDPVALLDRTLPRRGTGREGPEDRYWPRVIALVSARPRRRPECCLGSPPVSAPKVFYRISVALLPRVSATTSPRPCAAGGKPPPTAPASPRLCPGLPQPRRAASPVPLQPRNGLDSERRICACFDRR
jgi:hypothetical protein